MSADSMAESLLSRWKLLDMFAHILVDHDRVAIAGGPRSGKTTLSKIVTDRPIFGTDALIGAISWEDAPHEIMRTLAEMSGPRWVVEGVQVPRALRKGLAADAVLWLGGARSALTSGQDIMRKGVETVMRDWVGNSWDPARTHLYGWTP